MRKKSGIVVLSISLVILGGCRNTETSVTDPPEAVHVDTETVITEEHAVPETEVSMEDSSKDNDNVDMVENAYQYERLEKLLQELKKATE